MEKEVPKVYNPPGTDRDLGTSRGRQGGEMDVGHGGRIRHAAQGAETSGGGWQVADGYKVQVDDDPH